MAGLFGPISYEGTTYLPIRAVSNMLGIEVNWDGPTQTVWLGEGFVATPVEQVVSTSNNTTSSQDYYTPIPAGTTVNAKNGMTLTSTGEAYMPGKTLGGGYTICYDSNGKSYAVSNKTLKVTPLIDSDVDLGDGGQALADAGMITHTEEGSGGFYG